MVPPDRAWGGSRRSWFPRRGSRRSHSAPGSSPRRACGGSRPAPTARRSRRKARADALPRLIKRGGELWLGGIGALTPESGALRLVRALDRMPDAWHLVLVGEGPERDAVRAEALRLEIAHRVHVTGMLADPAPALGLFDLFALGADGETAPEPIAAAMAAGLAILAPRAGDLAEWLGDGAEAQLCPPGDEAALTERLLLLAGDAPRRRSLGGENRVRAAAFDLAKALAERRAVYAASLGLPHFP